MLPLSQKILFALFAAVTLALGTRGFYRLYRRIVAGRADTEPRFDHLPRRIGYALVTTLTQSRTFRKRPWVSFFHSFIFYGFAFYLLVNLVDAVDGYFPLSFDSFGWAGHVYILLADVLSALVLIGVIALVLRRFLLPSRRDFSFNQRTMLQPEVRHNYIAWDSILVSVFILFHVGSRSLGAGARVAAEGPDRFAPFASLVSHLFTPQNAEAWRIFGYWGALGSVLLFLIYFPYSKHLHLFMAPVKYLAAREVSSGVLPPLDLDMESDEPKLGAAKLEDLAWPRLLDAYACIQCNRCQDVCPATATGKALSPSAIEINKRLELNQLARHQPSFESGAPSPNPLLSFALSPEAAWACTTCGACIEVCPVQDDPMLDIIDVRRQQVMVAGEFPAQLQTAFRGMERAQNPWGINHDKRLDWAAGLNVKTTDENPEPDVLFWVGCAASYDPQSQKTARAFVQLLDHAGVDFAVLGKRECCTGDSARRAGNEYLYRQLADQNVATLNEVKPKLIVATCPHCMNTVGKEYAQVGGDFKVIHHTQYLETLVAEGRLVADAAPTSMTYHDPCYLGRHNGVYDAPRNVLNILSNDFVELPRNRENSFCCGAGGAQFWKEEEPGSQRISDNRFEEVQQRLNRAAAGRSEGAAPDGANGGSAGAEDVAAEKVLAVGCPFCKSMLESTPARGADAIAVRDVAELLLEGVERNAQRRAGGSAAAPMTVTPASLADAPAEQPLTVATPVAQTAPPAVAREQIPAAGREAAPEAESAAAGSSAPAAGVARAKWTPARSKVAPASPAPASPVPAATAEMPVAFASTAAEQRATAESAPRQADPASASAAAEEPAAASVLPAAVSPAGESGAPASTAAPRRKSWNPKVSPPTLQSAPPEAPPIAAAEPDALPVPAAAPVSGPIPDPVRGPVSGPDPQAAALPANVSEEPVKRKVWSKGRATPAASQSAAAAQEPVSASALEQQAGAAAEAREFVAPDPQAHQALAPQAPAASAPETGAAPAAGSGRKPWKPKRSTGE